MFEINRIYIRRELHDNYGGNRQGGIANCANHPLIFIFTGKSGVSHGYEDGWSEDNYFYYTGEGQKGDMSFKRGNKSILDHVKNNKEIHLFESQGKGKLKYIDEFKLVDYNYFRTPDTEGIDRKAIKFKLISASGKSKSPSGSLHLAKDINIPEVTERKGLVTSRVGQGYYRKRLLEKWNNKCAVSGCSITEILIASHIVPWKSATDKERLDPENGILLSPVYDALFDKYFISFDSNGEIIISNILSDDDCKMLGVTKNEKIKGLSKGNLEYLKEHRQLLKQI